MKPRQILSQPRQANNFFAVTAAKQFQTRTEEEIEQPLRDKSSKSTNKATDNAVRMLRDFYKEQNLEESFEELSKTDLNDLLRQFNTSARKCDGSLYSKSSLLGIRYGIARYLYLQQEKGLKITDDEAFSLANEAFSAVTTELKKLGKAKVNHHPEITKTDLQKFYNSFDITQPKDLLYKCLFDIVFFLVRRGRENSACANKQSQSLLSHLILEAENMFTKKKASWIKITVLMILLTIRHVMVACTRSLKVHYVL